VTRAGFDAVMGTVHLIHAVPDGDDFRASCWCGWLSLSVTSASAAQAERCAVELAMEQGQQRRARWLAQQEAA
jgi:hypothetical protein